VAGDVQLTTKSPLQALLPRETKGKLRATDLAPPLPEAEEESGTRVAREGKEGTIKGRIAEEDSKAKAREAIATRANEEDLITTPMLTRGVVIIIRGVAAGITREIPEEANGVHRREHSLTP
jgi:hypothetical protein